MAFSKRCAGALASLACFCLSQGAAGAGQKSHGELALDVIDGHILPRVQRLESAAGRLAADLEAFCASPGDPKLRSRAGASFKETVRALGAVDFLRFGPLTEETRLERFYFWPDPRSVASRQLAGLLAERNPALLEPGAFAGRSAAVQGLGALEIILDDTAQPLAAEGEDAHYKCAFASAVGKNLAAIAGEIRAAWSGPHGWRAKMLEPGSDNPLYRDASESAREIVKSLLVGLQLAQDRQVVPRLESVTAAPPKPARLPFARSKLNADYLEAALRSLEAMFEATGLIAYTPADKAWIRDWVRRAFDSLLTDAAAVRQFDREPSGDAKSLAMLRRMRFNLNGLRQIVNRVLAPAAGLILGFNELDGD